MGTTEYIPRYLTGRCRSGGDWGGILAHATKPNDPFAPALCGAKPGRLSNGWSDHIQKEVTCKKCLIKISNAERKEADAKLALFLAL